MRSNALNCTAVVVALQYANYASKAGAYPYTGSYPCAGAYADGAPRSGVIPLRAFLPIAPSIR